MRKIFTLTFALFVAIQLMAAGSASDPYLNITKYASIDEAGATVDGMETIYKYGTDASGNYWLTLSCYGVMKTDATQNWFTNEIVDSDNSSTYTGLWTATDVFQGPEAYFGSNTAYSAKNNKSPAKTQCFYVTFCTQVKLFAYNGSNSSYYLDKMNIYECTENADGTITPATTPIESYQNTAIGTEVLTSSALDPEKIYKVEISNAYGYFYEIAFKTPGIFDGEITPPVANDVTNMAVETVTMSWSASPGCKYYTVRVYPAPLRGLLFREKFSNFTQGQVIEDWSSLDNYTDNPEWQGYGLSGADAGVVIENNGYLSSPMSGVRIPGHQRFYTLKFKARPADGVESGELLVSMGGNTKTFTISGPEKYYTYVIERPYPDYWSVNNVFYTFKNTYYYNPYGDEEEEDHRVIISDFKVYHGDYSEPQSEPNPKYYPYPTPAWSEDSTFVDYIQNTSFTFGTASDQISLYFGNPQYNDYQYWSYDVKAVYYDGQESDWSNRIDFSLYPWPAYLNDDDDPVNPTVPGDVNGDGLVTSVDITALYNYLLNNDMSDIVNGDQSGDGEITSVDVTVVYNILLGGTPQ